MVVEAYPHVYFIFLDGAYDVRLRRGGEPAHGAAPARPHTAPLARRISMTKLSHVFGTSEGFDGTG